MGQDWSQERVLFTFIDVPVKVRPSFWPMWLSGWPVLIWLARRRKPQRSWRECVVIGSAAMPFPLAADLGHALAHTVSAKAADAPMDEIHLAADMPRTIYFDNDVTPDQHRLRALGGPVYSGTGLIISLVWRLFSRPGTASRELSEISCVSQALIGFGSLLPVSIVDGGTLLKWTLIERGATEEEADTQVKRVSIGVGIGLAAAVGTVLAKLFHKRRGRQPAIE